MTHIICTTVPPEAISAGIVNLTFATVVMLCLAYAASRIGQCVAILREIKELLERRGAGSSTTSYRR